MPLQLFLTAHVLPKYPSFFLGQQSDILRTDNLVKQMKPQRTSFSRLFYACVYSKDGLLTTFKEEAAFRQELLLFLLLLPLLMILPFPPATKMILFATHVIVLITELLNSAIEAVVDLVSPEHNLLAKKAKDAGSAAVFLSLLLLLFLWAAAVYSLLYQLL